MLISFHGFKRALAVLEENEHFLCLCHMEESALAVDKRKVNLTKVKGSKEIAKIALVEVVVGYTQTNLLRKKKLAILIF